MIKIINDQTSVPLEGKNSMGKTPSPTKNQIASKNISAASDDKLSSKALETLRATLKSTTEVDESLVKDIKSKIEAGTYQMDLKKLAEAIIDRSLIEDA